MVKRVKGCLDFSEAVADGENSDGTVQVTSNTDEFYDRPMGKQQWPNQSRDGSRFGPFAQLESFFPSAVMTPPPKSKKR